MSLLLKRSRNVQKDVELGENAEGGELISLPNEADSKQKTDRVDMQYLLKALIKYNASDLHIKPGRPPLFRVNGKLIPAKLPAFRSDHVNQVITGILTADQINELEKNLSLDFSFRMGDFGRFRCNVYFQRGEISAVLRLVPINVPSLEELSVPLSLKKLISGPRGLILITGPTGSGKSTTMAAMIQHINETRPVHIITIEDPIEFVHRDIKASITQREIGSDSHSFQDALRSGLRQDPDVIAVGEMRDLNTIQTVLTAAETGHLVLATLHTRDARSTLERIFDVFPAEAKNQVRVQLASSLVAVVSQNLLLRADGSGRIPACELMVKSPAIEQSILKGELGSIPDSIASSNTYYNMQTFNQDLLRLVKSGEIKPEEAIKVSNVPDELKLKLSGISFENGR